MISKISISPFQALTFLIGHYRADIENQTLVEHCLRLYLQGVRNQKDADIFEQLMKDPYLSQYAVVASKETINLDPVRREFETKLCFETFLASISELDLSLLQRHRDLLKPDKYLQDRQIRDSLDESFKNYKEIFHIFIKNLPRVNKLKQKIVLLHDIMYLNIYLTTDSLHQFFNDLDEDDKRGRLTCFTRHQSTQLGIMRYDMPVNETTPSFFLAHKCRRYAEKYAFIEGAQEVELTFSNGVTPFVGSISGGMARQIVSILELVDADKFVYQNNPQQLHLYFKCLISFTLFVTGNHSLDEFMRVLESPDIQQALGHVPGFSSLTLVTLFQKENAEPFSNALNATIAYNTQIFNQRIQSCLMQQCIDLSERVLSPIKEFIIFQKSTRHNLSRAEKSILGDARVIHATDRRAIAWLALHKNTRVLQWLLTYAPPKIKTKTFNKQMRWMSFEQERLDKKLIVIIKLLLNAFGTKYAMLLLTKCDIENSFLDFCAKNNGKEIIQALVELEPSLIKYNHNGYSLLHTAVLIGSFNLVSYLLEAGVDKQASSKANTDYSDLNPYDMSLMILNDTRFTMTKDRYEIEGLLRPVETNQDQQTDCVSSVSMFRTTRSSAISDKSMAESVFGLGCTIYKKV